MYFNEKIWIFTHFFVPVNGYNDKSIGQQSNNTDENVGGQKEVVPVGGNRTIVFVLPYQMMLKVFRTLRLRWWFFLWGHHHDLVLWKNFMNDGDSAEDRGWRNGGCKAHPRERREKKAFLGPHFRGQKPFKKLSVFWTMRCVTNESVSTVLMNQLKWFGILGFVTSNSSGKRRSYCPSSSIFNDACYRCLVNDIWEGNLKKKVMGNETKPFEASFAANKICSLRSTASQFFL